MLRFARHKNTKNNNRYVLSLFAETIRSRDLVQQNFFQGEFSCKTSCGRACHSCWRSNHGYLSRHVRQAPRSACLVGKVGGRRGDLAGWLSRHAVAIYRCPSRWCTDPRSNPLLQLHRRVHRATGLRLVHILAGPQPPLARRPHRRCLDSDLAHRNHDEFLAPPDRSHVTPVGCLLVCRWARRLDLHTTRGLSTAHGRARRRPQQQTCADCRLWQCWPGNVPPRGCKPLERLSRGSHLRRCRFLHTE